VREYALPIESAAEAGTLRDIEGLGEATTAKIEEFLATGRMRYLERLREEYPPTLLELLRIPALAPSACASCATGIATLDALKTPLTPTPSKWAKASSRPKSSRTSSAASNDSLSFLPSAATVRAGYAQRHLSSRQSATE
jgi:hypothetical protein